MVAVVVGVPHSDEGSGRIIIGGAERKERPVVSVRRRVRSSDRTIYW
jgi:hypothetical protein